MEVDITAWKKPNKRLPLRLQVATFNIYLTAVEIEKYCLAIHVVFAGSNRYRLTRSLAFLRTRGLTDLAETIEADIRRQEGQHQT